MIELATPVPSPGATGQAGQARTGKDRCQMSEVRGQGRTEVRGREETEVRYRRSDVGKRQMPDVRCQTSEDEKTEVRSRKSEVRDLKIRY